MIPEAKSSALDWRTVLGAVRSRASSEAGGRSPERTPPANELLFSLVLHRAGINLRFLRRRKRLKNGLPGSPTLVAAEQASSDLSLSLADRRVVEMTLGMRDQDGYPFWGRPTQGRPLTTDRLPEVIEAASQTGRLFVAEQGEDPWNQPGSPATWLGEPAWRFELGVREAGDHVELLPQASRGDEVRGLSAEGTIDFVTVIVTYETSADQTSRRFSIAPSQIDHDQVERWLERLPENEPLRVPADEAKELVAALLAHPDAPPLALEGTLRPPEERHAPSGVLRLDRAPLSAAGASVGGSVRYNYDGVGVDAPDPRSPLPDADRHRLLTRDPAAEDALLASLNASAFTDHGVDEDPEDGRLHRRVSVEAADFPTAVRTLSAAGWKLEFDGRPLRPSTSTLALRVSTGIDWFNVSGEADFDGTALELDAVLAAIARQERFVELGDGSVGLLPEAWLSRYAGLALLGDASEGGRRVASTQIALLDALLAAEPETDFDQAAAAARERLARLGEPGPREAPAGFKGELRDYQRAGLGWLHALDAIGLCGCLADEMGLGKTVQVLAWLQGLRNQAREDAAAGGAPSPAPDLPPAPVPAASPAPAQALPPALVVVPRSLLENWRREAERFTPGLSVLTLHGARRWAEVDARVEPVEADAAPKVAEAAATAAAEATAKHILGHDLVLTTYSTLRQDAPRLLPVKFSAAILDEAQAIKNPDTAVAKAVRLLRTDRRLAVTGTPVENHLGELLSVFDFLNPGMLRDASRILSTARANVVGVAQPDGTEEPPEVTAARQLSAAVKPFVLRRTKKQVAPELPDRIEETLWCEMPPRQASFYKKLAAAYRKSLLESMSEKKLRTSKILVLEALLRLRQAACLPGLADPKKAKLPGAKLEMLAERLRDVLDDPEGGKALVFSQFVGLLDHVRKPLDAAKVPYAYLDGKTTKRQAQVDRFQNDPDCRLMLISLKAGGTGLNLTAAEHVFLLDPWWNPATEAQAIDRAHRIGQSRTVFARRLITRGTVEEKVLALQEKKKQLADAVLGDPSSVMQSLSLDDLRELLS